MAWYDFQCEKCGSEFEQDLPMGSSLKPRCKACGSCRTVKVFSAAGIAFKGSGFYVTDSRGGGSSTKAEKPAAEAGTAAVPAADPAPAPAPAKPESSAKSASKSKES
ncbi:zinc ribbon domain-containing protein [bacterium]|nr:zinc ribbon domain-containing protein [bacterium]